MRGVRKAAKKKRRRPGTVLSRNGGKWTEADFRSFIKNNLRRASMRWGPRSEVKKAAKIGRGINPATGCKCDVYRCSECGKEVYTGKAIHVDHIDPVVPVEGWDSWDGVIERMFAEADKLQALCEACHKVGKTKVENEQRLAMRD